MPWRGAAVKRLRPGASWSRVAGTDSAALVTLVEFDPADGVADSRGRRPSDRNVGSVLGAGLAVEICTAVNERRDSS